MKHKNFVVFMLTHGRPEKQWTLKTLEKHGYTGDWYFILDNDDDTYDQYVDLYGEDKVLVFDKQKIMDSPDFDARDNFEYKRSVVYARYAAWEFGEALGYKYIAQFEDDYDSFRWRMSPEIEYSSKMVSTDKSYQVLDKIFDTMIDYLAATPRLQAICTAQSGDYIGGGGSKLVTDHFRRKAMNGWITDIDRRFRFDGTQNDDTNSYTTLATRGMLFLTTAYIALNQRPTQHNASGNSEMYLDFGTYVKSFYSLMAHPSGMKISVLYNTSARKGKEGKDEKTNKAVRIHHKVKWRYTAPMIVSRELKKI